MQEQNTNNRTQTLGEQRNIPRGGVRCCCCDDDDDSKPSLSRRRRRSTRSLCAKSEPRSGTMAMDPPHLSTKRPLFCTMKPPVRASSLPSRKKRKHSAVQCSFPQVGACPGLSFSFPLSSMRPAKERGGVSRLGRASDGVNLQRRWMAFG